MRRPSTPRLGLLAILGSNAVAPLGVLFLGWSTTVLLAVFAVEVVAVLCWSLVKIPFARKRPNDGVEGDSRLFGPFHGKRGSVTLPGPVPPLYPRNLLPLLVAAAFLAPLELGLVLGLFGLADPTVTDEMVGRIALGGVGVFVGHGVETASDYFHDEGYRHHSPRSAFSPAFRQFFAVGALLFLAGAVTAVGTEALVTVVVVGKFAHDLRTYQVEHDPEKRGLFARLFGSAETEIAPVPVAVPAESPAYRTRPGRLVTVFDAVYRGVRYTVTSAVLYLYVLVGAAVFVGAPQLAVYPLVLASAFAALRALSRYVRVGTVEYRCYGDVLVVYDTVLDEPQARLERGAVTGVAVRTDVVDRLFGTRTVTFDAATDDATAVRLTAPDPDEVEDDANANRPLTLPHVEDAAAVAEAFGVGWQFERDVGGAD